MQSFESQNPNSFNGEQTNGFIIEKISNWPFEKLDDTDNIKFCYQIVRWVYDVYGENNLNYNIGDIDGNILPASIKPLIAQDWHDGTHYSDENKINIFSEPEIEYISPVIPKFDELLNDIGVYTEIFEIIKNTPEIHENIVLPKKYIIDSLRIKFESKYYHNWGLDFRISAHNASVVPYGKSGETSKPFEYAQTYNDKIRSLTRTILDLTLLAAEHSIHKNYVCTSSEMIEELNNRISENKLVLPDTKSIYKQDGIKELIIRDLIKSGIINPPPKSD